ncbi:MAG: hypothetical protein JSR86_08020 [Proteobacteria bacterium]|nr:hypothetical protein [Pseudomonadota bacterium]
MFLVLARSPGLTAHVSVGFTFNEMLVRLLQGRFDLTASTIGNEAFQHGGRTYAYFGVFCALLRLPLMALGGIRTTDVTVLSIATASSVSLMFRIACAVTVFRTDRAEVLAPIHRTLIVMALAFGGETVQFLRPSVFQEVVSWGDALAAGFVFVALRVVLGLATNRTRAYAAMATFAGLALLCRFSFGLGLSAALGLMLAADVLQSRPVGSLGGAVRRAAPATAILTLALCAVGAVNYGRWGDPFLFIPLREQAFAVAAFPDRLARVQQLGEFNLARIPFALQYYFAPIWELQRPDGTLLFQAHQLKYFDVVELPPGSLLLSDPLICLLAVGGVVALVRGPSLVAQPWQARAALLGLAIPALVMLGAIALTFRYRMEFYPALDFAAWIGLNAFIRRGRPLGQRAAPMLSGILAVGLLVAGMSRVAYAVTPFGSLTDMDAPHGWTSLYWSQGGAEVKPAGHMMPNGARLPFKAQLANDGPAEF